MVKRLRVLFELFIVNATLWILLLTWGLVWGRREMKYLRDLEKNEHWE